MTKRVAFYTREILDGNSLADQIVALTKIAACKNWSVVKTYLNQMIIYDKNPQSGSGFCLLCEASSQQTFDLVMVWSTDRIGCSLREFLGP